MAITVQMRTQVSQLYVALFGRAPDAEGLGFWVNQLNTGKTVAQVAQSMYEVTAARAYYPSFLTNGEIIASFYKNVLGRDGDTEGLAYWTAKLNAAGATPGSVMAEMIAFVADYTGTDPAGVLSHDLFANKAAVAQYYGEQGGNVANATTALANVTADAGTVTTSKAAIDVINHPPVNGATISLTTGADVPTSTTADDIFVGTESTLSSADVIKGGTGTDTLRVANSGVAKTFSGFELDSIETVQVTADGTGATAFDVTGTVGVTKLANNGSSQDLTFTGVKVIPSVGLSLSGVTAGNTTLTFESDAVVGTADTLNVALDGAKTITNTAVGTITANGIETIAVKTSGSASNLTAINSDKLKAMTVAGDKSLTLAGVTFTDNVAVNTLNASGLTGTAALNVTVTANTATLDVAVTGGAGDDRADFSTGFDTRDAFTGGAGRDTLALTQVVASAQTAATGGTVSGVEILEITNGGTGTVNMDNFAGVDTVYYSGLTGAGALTGAVTVSNAVTGVTVRDAVDAAAQNVTVTLKTNGTADVANFIFDKVAAADTIGTLSAAEFETVNITATDDATVLDTGTLTVTAATLTAATKVTVTGDANLTITTSNNPTTAVLATFDASTATGKVVVSGTNLRAGGAAVTLGAGDDTFNVATAAGADTFDLTKGGKDKIVYTTVAQSSSTGTDTIKGFTSGNDIIDLTAAALLGGGTNGAGVADATQFVGNKASFGEAQGALAGTGANTQSAVFDTSTGILWVDSDKNGTLDANDFRIKLDGVTSLTAADLGLAAAAGVGLTLTAAAASVNTTTKTNATASTTAFNDTINTTIANMVGSTVDGSTGTDSLVMTDAGAVVPTATITNVETLVLNTTGSTPNTVAAFNNAGIFANITGSSNSDTIASTLDMREGGTISLGAGNDTITAVDLLDSVADDAVPQAGTSTKVTIDMGAGDDTVTTGTLVTWSANTIINGGDGTADTLILATTSNTTLGSFSNFEAMTTGAAATVTAAQFASVAAITNGGTITVTGATAAITANATSMGAGDAITFSTALSANTVTLSGNSSGTINGNTGVDTVTGSVTDVNALTLFAAGGGADVLNITGFNAATDLTGNITGVETINLTGAGGATLTLDAASATTLVDASALTSGFTLVTGAGATAGFTVKGTAFADVITNTGMTVAATYNLNNGDSIGAHIATTADTFNVTANSTGTTSVTIAEGSGAAAKDTIKLFNAAGTQVSLQGFALFSGAFSGGGIVSAKATDSGANTVVQIDMNGDGLFGANDIQLTLTGVTDTTAGEGSALFSIVSGAIVIL